MSLLTLCQSVANDIGIDAQTTIVSNSDATAKRLLAQAQNAGRSLMRRYNWMILQREHTFTTTASQEEYALPTDFHRFIDETAWDRDQFWSMRGPLSPQEWQVRKSGLAQSGQLRKNWRVKRASASAALKFVIDPTPADSTTDLVFEYISKHWCASSGGTAQEAWAADADTGILDEYLIEIETRWRVLERLGLIYQEAKDEADSEIDKAYARDGGAPILNLSRSGFRMPPVNVPETGYGS